MENKYMPAFYTDFYRLPKATYIGVYGESRYIKCSRGAMQVKHYLDAGIKPQTKPVARTIQADFNYAKSFIALTIDVMQKRGLINS